MGISGTANANTLDGIMKSGTIRIAVPQDFPPFGSVGLSLQPEGYDIDTARLIAHALGVKLVLVPVTSDNRIPYLQTNKVDLVISSLGKTPDRAKVIDFSEDYAPFFSGVFGPPGLDVSKPADLAGKTIGVTRGAIEDLVLTQIAPPGAVIHRYGDNASTIAAFLSGQSQLIATANSTAAVIIARHPPRLPELKFVLKNSPCYIGVAKGNPALLAKVNAIIAQAKQDGALNKISVKWLDMPLPAGF
jgi:polar amino acid transport system substrate-binding protein